MIKKSLILSLLLLASCGPAYDSTAVIDPNFSSIVSDFEASYSVSAKGISIEFTEEYNDVVNNRIVNAVCIRKQGKRSIKVSSSMWNILSEDRRKALIFHELGHCAMFKPHNDAVYEDGCPKSLMATYLIDQQCYNMHKQELLFNLPIQ